MIKIISLVSLPLLLAASLLAPSNLTLTPSRTSVTLSWTDNSLDEKSFKIFRNGILIDVVDENVTTYKDTYLLLETEYNYTIKATDGLYFSEKQIQIADEFVSIFENSSLAFDYNYTAELNDTRGITAGRIGFTSATGDMLRVIERYTVQSPNNALAKFIPELRYLEYLRYELEDKEESASVENLEGLSRAWAEIATQDERFRQLQNKAAYDEYLFPTLQKAHDLGMKYPLSMVSLYDTSIQHGYNGLVEIVDSVSEPAPNEGGDEERWLREFNAIRKAILEDDSVWEDSVVRVKEFLDILDLKNYDLAPFTMVIEEYSDETYELGASN